MSTPTAAAPRLRAAAPTDIRCARCGGSAVEPTDPAQCCWGCGGTGIEGSADDTYRGEP
ncbi:hypothetical protein [Embleya scabrispora]|uniref:hypothetical protein n=1 Tax=Embleya scabrispora TaxID=159449 RepID=UPI001374C87B|nr:hypothetical protein [Embleya scabrispora]